MHVNADFTTRAAVHLATADWTPSPMPGVQRRMLDRVGAEVARATSLVRYAPGSRFAPHSHGGGEEFLVLEGVFADERGLYPVGTYVRNPPGSEHTPASASGCTIFVKLWQFDPADRRRVVLDTGSLRLGAAPDRPEVKAAILFENAHETVRVARWAAGARIRQGAPGGLELLCLAGGFTEGGELFGRWSWLRLPAGAVLDATVGPQDCRVWLKEGHLRFPPPGGPPAASGRDG